MSLRNLLRQATQDDHAVVDRIFAHFSLSDRAQYRAFLQAHARAVPAVEEALDAAGVARLIPDWPERRRRHLLLEDLSAMHVAMPPSLARPHFASPEEVWGAAYVLEGSKLGGAMLAKAVPAGFPSAYLSPRGPKGAMKTFMDSLDHADIGDASKSVEAARTVFDLFRRAAEMELEPSIP